MMKFLNLILGIAMILGNFLLSSCQTDTKKNQENVALMAKNFLWETKAVVRDLRRNKTNSISVDFIAVKNEKLRLEIRGTLGVQVGTLVMNRDQFIAILFLQKRIYKGHTSEKVLAKSFNIPIPPQALYSIAYDEEIKQPQWKCQFENKIVSICENQLNRTRIEWKNRKEGTKLVSIKSPNVEVDWFFNPPEELQLKPETFVVELPEGYKTTVVDNMSQKDSSSTRPK